VNVLQQVKIANFRSLRAVDVPLRPLTVLIGPNDTGKSAFLAALQYLVNGIGFQPGDFWRYDTSAGITLSGTTARGTWTHSTPGQFTNPEIAQDVRPCGLFHLLAQGATMESQGHYDEQGPPALASNGEGVPTLFDYLLRRDRKRFFEAVGALRQLVPGLNEVLIGTPHPQVRRLELVVEDGLQLPAGVASSGVRLLLVFVALAYHPAPPRMILLEEPETGLHPRRLKDVMDLLRELTEGKHGGSPTQVILTTHSPHLLDLVDLEKDQVLVFSRQEDGSRIAEPADPERLKGFLDEFHLGEVWYNQREEGLVAKKT
jgi:predicted ATPase